MASDIEKKLDAIFDYLMSDLTRSAAIDKEYKIDIDKCTFYFEVENRKRRKKIVETEKGFSTLSKNLPNWIDEQLILTKR